MIDTHESWAAETFRRLNSLPARSMTVLSLLYFSRLSPSQICAHTGWSEQSVRAAAAAGLLELGRLMQEDATSEPRHV